MELSIRFILSLIQRIPARLLRNKKHYLNAPDEILSWLKVDRIYLFGHLFPTIVLTVIMAIKIPPLISVSYSVELKNNSSVIPLTFFICLFVIVILNGIVMERILMRNNKYLNYVKNGNASII